MAKKKTAPPADSVSVPTDIVSVNELVKCVNDLVQRLKKLEDWARDAKDRLPNLPEAPAS
jgi:hypothetical protein